MLYTYIYVYTYTYARSKLNNRKIFINKCSLKESLQKKNIPTEKCSSSLAIRDIFIKTILNFYLTPVQISNINQTAYKKMPEEWGKRLIIHCWWDGIVNWCSHYGNQCSEFSKNLKINILYDPATPLVGVWKGWASCSADTCSAVFTDALCTTASTWKQTKCPLTDGRLLRLW